MEVFADELESGWKATSGDFKNLRNTPECRRTRRVRRQEFTFLRRPR